MQPYLEKPGHVHADASYLLRNITKVKIKLFDKIYDQIKGINKAQEMIIKAFGDYALGIYGLS